MLGPVICTPLMDQMSIQLQFTLGNTVNVKIVEFSPLMVIFIYFLLQTVSNRIHPFSLKILFTNDVPV